MFQDRVRRFLRLPKPWSNDDEKVFVHRRFLGVITYHRLAWLLAYVFPIVSVLPFFYLEIVGSGNQRSFNYVCSMDEKLLELPDRAMLMRMLCDKSWLDALSCEGDRFTAVNMLIVVWGVVMMESMVAAMVRDVRCASWLRYMVGHSVLYFAMGVGVMTFTVTQLWWHGDTSGVAVFIVVMMTVVIYCLLVAHVDFAYMLDLLEFHRRKTAKKAQFV